MASRGTSADLRLHREKVRVLMKALGDRRRGYIYKLTPVALGLIPSVVLRDKCILCILDLVGLAFEGWARWLICRGDRGRPLGDGVVRGAIEDCVPGAGVHSSLLGVGTDPMPNAEMVEHVRKWLVRVLQENERPFRSLRGAAITPSSRSF